MDPEDENLNADQDLELDDAAVEDDDLPVDDDLDDADELAENSEDEDPDADPDAVAASGDQPKPSRRTIRVQKLEKERDAERQRASELQARLDGVLAAQRQPVNDEARRAEEARVAAMDPAERERYEDKKQLAALSAQVSNLGFAQEDGLDRARFEAKAEVDPLYKKYADSVEKTLQDMRAKGVNSSREAILTYKIGEAALRKKAQGVGADKKKQAAQARVNSTKGRPANLRGDSSGSGKGKTEEDRLRGVQI